MPSLITHTMSIWNAAAILLVLAMIVIAVVRWKSLPEQLPSHYDFAGRPPESWTGRRFLWFYPIIALAVIFLAATEGEKAAPVSLFLVAVLLYHMLCTLAIADRRADRLPPWFMPGATFGVILVVLFSYLS